MTIVSFTIIIITLLCCLVTLQHDSNATWQNNENKIKLIKKWGSKDSCRKVNNVDPDFVKH
jgi:hypothetical protein